MNRPFPVWQRTLLGVGVLAGLALLILSQSCGKGAGKQPLELGFWYWHSPFTLSPEEEKDLREHGLNKMFVRAGTFSTDGGNAVLAIPQSYQRIPDLEIHLVFNFDSGFVRHFEEFDLAKVSEQVATRIEAQLDRAAKLGVEPTGVQLDLDSPTRLLPRYAEFVRRIRSRVKGEWQWSATALMSWLGTKGVETLSRELDFIVPQAYEGVTGRTVDTMRPVSDPDYLRSVMGKAEKLACPYYFGIPAYGHGFLFDDRGKLADIYQKIGPAEAMRHPSFQFQEAYPSDRLGQPAKDQKSSVGEEVIKFKAIRPSPSGRGVGYTLGFSVPSPELLRQMWDVVRENAGPKCRGAIIYRYPEPEATLTLTLPGILDVLQGNRPQPNLSLATDSERDNFEIIEGRSPHAEASRDFFISIQNTGNAATFVSPDAVEVIVEFDRPGMGDVRLRDFDKVQPGSVSQDGKFQETPPRHASAIRLSKSYLGAKQKAHVGPIRLLESDAQIRQIRWIIRDGKGFDSYQGTIPAPTEPTRKPLK